jgi:two-component system response regulator LytT
MIAARPVLEGLAVLAVDDEPPALDEMNYLLRANSLVGEVELAATATDALLALRARSFDVILADIAMPGLDGLALASIVAQFNHPPAVIFVTAHDEYALSAFDVGAVGYVLKPVDGRRLDAALRRVAPTRGPLRPDPLDTLVVESAGRTTLVARSEVAWVESSGDYVRVHTFDGRSLLVRLPLSRLEEAWSEEGYLRVHRQYLICLKAVKELRSDGAGLFVEVAGASLPVSRRHVRDLRQRLVRPQRRHHL